MTVEGRGALIGEEGTPQSTVQMSKPSEFSLGPVETADLVTGGAHELWQDTPHYLLHI